MVKELKTYERKYCSNCSRYGWYQKGYENGQKAGLQQGHDMIEKLLKEHQSKMDKLLAYEGENSMRECVIYLCGGMGKFGKENFNESNEWRLYCKRKLENCPSEHKVRAITINPNDYFNFLEDTTYNSQKEVMEFDLYKVRNSDLLIVNFNDMYSLGSMSEMAIAYDRRIPIIGLNTNNQELHPWQHEMCNRIFNDIDKMLAYIKNFYLT